MTDKLFIFGLPSASMLANVAIDTLSPDTHISLGVAVAVGGVILGACWWLATKFKGIDDKLENLEKHVMSIQTEHGCNRRRTDE